MAWSEEVLAAMRAFDEECKHERLRMRDALPFTCERAPSARMALASTKIDVVALIAGGLKRGYPYRGAG